MEGEPEQSSSRPWYRSLARALNTTATGNAQAFGFSITITITFGIVSSLAGEPSVPQVVGFGLAAVAAFSALNVLTAMLMRSGAGGAEPKAVILLATATDFLAVGAGAMAAVVISWALAGWAAWLLAPFCAGVVYILVQSIELVVGESSADRE